MVLSIPVKPYSAKYLVLHLGQNYRISNYDSFGIHLMQLLRRNLYEKKYEPYLKNYQATFQVDGLTTRLFCEKGHRHLTARTIVDFNSFVERVIKQDLHSWIDLYMGIGQEREQAIEGFRVKHGFTEDDWSMAAMVKSHQRYQKRRKKAGFAVEFVQQQPIAA